MRIAYLILGHKNPDHILRMMKTLHTPGTNFVLHIDNRAPDSVYAPLAEYARTHPHVILTRRVTCYWGGFGIAQATIYCIQAAAALAGSFDYAVFLSGQDYPIKTNAGIQQFFTQHRGHQFLESFSLVQPNRWTSHGGPFQSLNRVQHWAISYRSHMRFIPWKRKFPLGYEPHGGSQWWSLSHDCLLYVDQFLRTHPAFVRFFKHVFIPDESLFQSILSNSPFRDTIVSDDLRYIDWERPNPNYPRTLDDDDFERLKASPKLFARKFEIGRGDALLERIDRELLATAPEPAHPATGPHHP